MIIILGLDLLPLFMLRHNIWNRLPSFFAATTNLHRSWAEMEVAQTRRKLDRRKTATVILPLYFQQNPMQCSVSLRQHLTLFRASSRLLTSGSNERTGRKLCLCDWISFLGASWGNAVIWFFLNRTTEKETCYLWRNKMLVFFRLFHSSFLIADKFLKAFLNIWIYIMHWWMCCKLLHQLGWYWW